MITTTTAYDEAAQAIAAGQAEGHAHWVLIADEHERDGYALRPMPWEGPGEYQRVQFTDGRDGYIRIPSGCRQLPTNWGKRPQPEEARVAAHSIHDPIEARIAAKVVDVLLAAFPKVAVWEGEDWALKGSSDKAAIMAALASTDSDQLIVNHDGKRAMVLLIWGNGCDLISDNSVSLEEILAPAEAFVETLGA